MYCAVPNLVSSVYPVPRCNLKTTANVRRSVKTTSVHSAKQIIVVFFKSINRL